MSAGHSWVKISPWDKIRVSFTRIFVPTPQSSSEAKVMEKLPAKLSNRGSLFLASLLESRFPAVYPKRTKTAL